MPRIAYFPDSFHEVNGVAHTSRHYQAWAVETNTPFLCVRAAVPVPRTSPGAPHVRSICGDSPSPHPVTALTDNAGLSTTGNLTTLDLPRSRAKVRLERDLFFDPLFARHAGKVLRALREFKPDILHITGPSDVGLLGAWAARKLRIPLAAGWHTNLHEYAGTRTAAMMKMLPEGVRAGISRTAEDGALQATLQFYRLAKVLFAPNPELATMLGKETGHRCHLMERGIDTQMFSPERRTRPDNDGRLVLGYVGRISAEKNVGALVTLANELERSGVSAEFLIVGHGLAETELRAGLKRATFAGVLKGSELAAAYANMDMFVFPSETDTFGNVVLEALASGTPALVTPHGGPRYLVRNGTDGYVTEADAFTQSVLEYTSLPATANAQMSGNARGAALERSWDAVFFKVVDAYAAVIRH